MKIKASNNNTYSLSLSVIGGRCRRTVQAVFDTGASISSVPFDIAFDINIQCNGTYEEVEDASGVRRHLPKCNMLIEIDGKQLFFEPTIRKGLNVVLIGMDIISQGTLIIQKSTLEFIV